MTHAERTKVFRDTAIIAAITAALLLALPVAAFVGIALQLAVAIILPIALGAAILVALFMRRRQRDASETVRVRGLSLPEGTYFHERHSWARPGPRGRIRTGINDLLRRALPSPEQVEFPQVGTRLMQGEVLATISRGARTLRVKAPFDGTVVAINSAAGEEPGLITRDPYEGGWLVDLKPTNGIRALDELRDTGSARYWIRREVDRLFEMVSETQASGPALADGGEPTEDFGATLDDDTWNTVTERLF